MDELDNRAASSTHSSAVSEHQLNVFGRILPVDERERARRQKEMGDGFSITKISKDVDGSLITKYVFGVFMIHSLSV